MGWNCKECGTYNEESAVKCIICNADRPATEFKDSEPVPSSVTETARGSTASSTSGGASHGDYGIDRAWLIRLIADKKKKLKIIICSLLAVSFVVGQLLLYLLFCLDDTVFILSEVLKKTGNVDFNMEAFIGVMTVVEAAATVLFGIGLSYYIEKNSVIATWIFTIPFCITAIMMPSLTAFGSLIIGIGIVANKKLHTTKVLAICYAVVMLLMIIIYPSVVYGMQVEDEFPDSIKYGDAIYVKQEDSLYYLKEYKGSDDLLSVPRIINGKYEVGGILYGFNKDKNFYLFDLDYEYATGNNGLLWVVAFELDTDEKMPIPERDGYTFYGWWSTESRNTGKQIVNEKGKIILDNITDRLELHAMWYGSDYVFIDDYSDFVINNNKKYVLTNDIVISGNYTPIGGLSGMETQSSRSAFNGVFDGNYHTIKYSITGSRRYNGLFSWIGSNGVVKNLGVNANINVEFKPTSTEYYAFAGGIAAINDGTILNCWCEGSIFLKSATSVAEAGGIAGASGTDNVRTGEIRECYNVATIETVAYDAYAGGILGSAQNNGHIVSYCYNRGTVKATGSNSYNMAAGGIISHGRTYAKNCFNAGIVKTSYYDWNAVGGILGYTRDTSAHGNFPSHCVWLKTKDSYAQWGIGTYPKDTSGGNNKGVTVVFDENYFALKVLNEKTNKFVLYNSQIRLSWEKLLSY